ncbi:response regulator [Paenibacillus naphthalenovorans]|uniref:response regulator n=1 Tax=Paenibacillus naphthalenovorans TaxID=162209 RepID=UPI00087E31BC|nr:response regulator [Paenibacillus naphthalenovorans]SDH84216.1 Two-component response regulator, YesN/AraC family, consists of REC and AraC-type DNA-binding domains [Paenibacillus naphthalenovorans]
MKICVADDEKEVRESIIYKLTMLFPSAKIFDVGFGKMALEQISLVKPDLVFMDIRMPEMDGLEILRSIQRTYPTMQVVILSGYDDFEYARKALQYGAVDYLLKPADREQLREVVEKVKLEMDVLLLKEMESVLVKLSNQYVFVHNLKCYNTGLWFDEREWKEILFGDPAELCKTWESHPDRILLSFSVNFDYGGVVVHTPSGQNRTSFREKHDFLSSITAGIEQWESERFFEGQRERGEAALEKNGKEAARKAVSLRQHILSYAKIGDIPHLEAALDHWLNSLEELEFHQLKKECVNLMALLDEGLTSKNELIVLEEEKIHYWTQWVSKHKTWSELKQKIWKFVLDGVRALTQLENQSSLSWFRQALQLVDTSRDPNLSLEMVADAVGVHPVTLSRIFKQQTGMNFVKYMIRSRLRHAQTLLLQTDKKINEISEAIGYMDYRYFRTLFKKEFGLTPSEYRRGNGFVNTGDETE